MSLMSYLNQGDDNRAGGAKGGAAAPTTLIDITKAIGEGGASVLLQARLIGQVAEKVLTNDMTIQLERAIPGQGQGGKRGGGGEAKDPAGSRSVKLKLTGKQVAYDQELRGRCDEEKRIDIPKDVTGETVSHNIPHEMKESPTCMEQVRNQVEVMCLYILKYVAPATNLYTTINKTLGRKEFGAATIIPLHALGQIVQMLYDEQANLLDHVSTEVTDDLKKFTITSTAGMLSKVEVYRSLVNRGEQTGMTWPGADTAKGGIWQKARVKEFIKAIQPKETEPLLMALRERLLDIPSDDADYEAACDMTTKWFERHREADSSFGKTTDSAHAVSEWGEFESAAPGEGIKCWNCDKYGHVKADCKSTYSGGKGRSGGKGGKGGKGNKGSKGRKGGKGGKGRKGGKGGKGQKNWTKQPETRSCYNCHTAGHLASACPQKNAGDATKGSAKGDVAFTAMMGKLSDEEKLEALKTAVSQIEGMEGASFAMMATTDDDIATGKELIGDTSIYLCPETFGRDGKAARFDAEKAFTVSSPSEPMPESVRRFLLGDQRKAHLEMKKNAKAEAEKTIIEDIWNSLPKTEVERRIRIDSLPDKLAREVQLVELEKRLEAASRTKERNDIIEIKNRASAIRKLGRVKFAKKGSGVRRYNEYEDGQPRATPRVERPTFDMTIETESLKDKVSMLREKLDKLSDKEGTPKLDGELPRFSESAYQVENIDVIPTIRKAIAVSGASGVISGDPSMFDENIRHDPTAKNMKTAGKTVLGHKRFQWLMTSFYDDQGQLTSRFPLRFRYEPDAGAGLVLISIGQIIDVSEDSSAVIGNTKEQGISIIHKGEPLAFVPFISPTSGTVPTMNITTEPMEAGPPSLLEGIIESMSTDMANNVTDGQPETITHGTIASHALVTWHGIFNHRSDQAVRETVNNGRGGKITSTTRPICTSCQLANGRRQDKNRHVRFKGTDQALDRVLGNGATTGLSLAQIDAVKITALKAIIKMQPANTRSNQTEAAVKQPITQPFQKISTDYIGPFHMETKGGGKVAMGFMVYTDYATGYLWVYRVESKADAWKTLEYMVDEAKTLSMKIGSIIVDPAGENTSKIFKDVCRVNGIKHLPICARSQWGSYVERKIQQLQTDVRVTLIHGKLPMITVDKVMAACVDKHNKISAKGLGWKSPHYAMYGVDADLAKESVIGSYVYVAKPNILRRGGAAYKGKLGPQAIPGLYFGSDKNGMSHNIMRLDENHVGKMLKSSDFGGEQLSNPRKHAPQEMVDSGMVKSSGRKAGSGGRTSQPVYVEDQFGGIGQSTKTIEGPRAMTENQSRIEGLKQILAGIPKNTQETTTTTPMEEKVEDIEDMKAEADESESEEDNPVNEPRRSSRNNRGVRHGFREDVAYGTSEDDGTLMLLITECQDGLDGDQRSKIQVGETDDADAIMYIQDDQVDYVICREDPYRTGTKPTQVEGQAFVSKDSGLNYNDAIGRNPDPAEVAAFQEALHQEWDVGIVGKRVVEYVSVDDIPEGTVVGNLMTIFCVKRHQEPGPLQGTIRKYKARVVFRGDQVDTSKMTKDETYAPTVDLSTARILMAMTKSDEIYSVKADVTGAFLNASPTSRVIARTSQGCHKWDAKGRRMLVALLMNLYGSVEAAARWCAICVQHLLRIGFRQSMHEPCLFRFAKNAETAFKEMKEWRENPDVDLEFKGVNTDDETYGGEMLFAAMEAFSPDPGDYEPSTIKDSRDIMESMDQDIHYYNSPADHTSDICGFEYQKTISNQPGNGEKGVLWVLMSLYVDDVLIVSNSEPLAQYIKDRFLHLYPGTHEETPNEFLGQVMTRGRGTVRVDQDVLLLQTVASAHMARCKPAKVPMQKEIVVGEPDQIEAERYEASRKMDCPVFNGKNGYLRHGHPWSVYAHGQFARVASRPTLGNVQAMKQYCRYLLAQQGRGVKFREDVPQELFIYVDSNFDDVTFTGIYVFALGGCIYAKSVRQRFISLSTFDSELAGMSEAAKTALLYRAILRDCGIRSDFPTMILGDNKAAIDELTNFKTGGSKKPRHHRVRAAWTKQLVALKLIEFRHIPTDENIADLGTKAVSDKEKWKTLKDQLMGVTRPVAIVRIAKETGRV